ncbi:hypothetical protein [Blastococcus goldschmidtiae]|uniref:DUF317 domain-containing protein n=1 Tax=Blastococcus goldschmidtiae TaxID=3075546 RepID=A0ABU2K3M8_9ACTN|nr:hypothetical protein [Blastococcus sp. DSM 46792]MDT0274800.1 hypothetical protein [Blastococcus sp. DSM 46792]
MHLGGLPVETDVSCGVWISSARRRAEPRTVAALLPETFEAYARVFHPAVSYAGDDDVEVPWAEVADYNGTTVHPLMQWHTITGSWDAQPSEDQAMVWDDGPPEGHLPVQVAARLAGVLARHTATPEDCVFGRWDGFGYDLPDPGTPPRLLLRGEHDVVLVRGTVADATRNLAPEPHEQSANLWWPADHAWCVATDLDLTSTYVGATIACIAELLGTPGVEALPVRPPDPTSLGCDDVNPVPPGR